MPFLPYVPFLDCAEVAFIGTMGSQLIIFSFAVKKSGGFVGTDLLDLANEADAWWENDMRGSIADDYTLDTIKVTDLTTAVSPVVTISPAANPTGAVTGTAAPNNCAQLLSLNTAKRGRSYRGRVYLPGIPSSGLLDASHITTTQQAANQAAATAWQSRMADILVSPVVLSRVENGVRRTVGEPTAITTIVAKSLIATQRRRIAGRGA